ncbi:MAG: hypothetical protein ABEJ23_01190 [Haloarculaceae archaeon]
MASSEPRSRPAPAPFAARVLVLAVVAFAVGWATSEGAASPLADGRAPFLLAKALLDVTVLSYVAARSRWRGPALVGSLLFVYAGLQTLAVVEVGLYGLMGWPVALQAAARSVVVGGVIAAAVAAAFGRLRGRGRPRRDDRLRLPAREWAWKLPVLVVAFLACFLAGGVVVFLGVGRLVDPAALATYDLLEPPDWIFHFQAVRGLVYLGLLLPVLAQLDADARESQFVGATTLAVLVSSGVVVPNAGIPGLLWVAHFAELFASVFVYGLVAAALVWRHHDPLARLRHGSTAA